MRYVYQEPVITTVSDDEIGSVEEIKALFEKFKEVRQNIGVEFEDTDNYDFVRKFDNARITEVHEDSVDFHVFFGNATARYRNVPFLNVRKVRVVASKQLLSKKYNVSRWHMMDVAEIDGI